MKTRRLSEDMPTKWRILQPLSLLVFKTRVARIVKHGQEMRDFFSEKYLKIPEKVLQIVTF